MEPAEEQAVTAEFSGKQVASPVVTKVYSREVLRPSTRVADMAELLGDLYQGDSWNYPGMKDTQILHTTSDVSSDSPSHAKVEEQSSFKMLHIGASNGLRGAKSPTIVKVATPDRSSPTDMPSSTPDGTTVQADRHLAISNSSNSSACCMPSPVAQGAPSYDIKASARTAELRHAGMASSEASRSHFSTAAAQHNQVPAVAQQSRYPNHVLQSMMAHAFDDVDSGRHQHDDLDSPPALSGPPMHHRRPISQQDSILPAYRSFFPSADPSSLPLQPQLFNHFQLPPEQILPPELLDRPHHARPDQHYGSHTTQEPGQSSNFPTFPALSDPVQDVLLQMSSDMRQWPSPAGSSARQGPAFTAAQHHMEGLEITGAIKRDHASFTGPTSQSRQAKPQPRRALSFTQASASSDAPLAAAASTGGGSGGGRRGDNGSQAAASGSRLSSPGSHAATPPETDASLSDGDDASGSDTAGANTKRRKVVKGKRGAGRRPCRIVCRNCAASQTPQWRCGPDGPRTLCNACGVRYKKGLPLTGGAATNGSS